jgi:L-threonylcarbamoyladenylate synthase
LQFKILARPVSPPATRIVPATPTAIAAAARALRKGTLVAFPTETVYGLGADATNDRAVAAIFAAKGRPRFNPLIAHVAAVADARALVVFDHRAETLAEVFWPGPLTLVLPRAPNCPVSLLVSAGLDTLAVRIPDHPVARDLLSAVGRPLAAPSANPSNRPSPTTAEHVARTLAGRVSTVLDGGPCRVGLESTVLDLTGAAPTILRAGGVPAEVIALVIGPIEERLDAVAAGARRRSPGQSRRHYAPSVPLRRNARAVRPGEALLAFGPRPLPGAVTVLNLSPAGDLTEAAANFFAMLHALDDPKHAGIAVMPIPDKGLGRAINDRLRRAAADAEG